MAAVMKLLGLIGFPLGHSFSRDYFAEKFRHEGIPDFDYRNFPIADISMLPGVIRDNPNLAGLNVTIPYKELVIPYLNEIDPLASAIGAVNVIRIERTAAETILKGFNTDCIGIESCLNQWILPPGIQALVFGTGGSSKAVLQVLNSRCIPFLRISRSKKDSTITYPDINSDVMSRYRLLINCTPVGMFPLVNEKIPISYSCLTPDHFLLDLIYNPSVTAYMQEGLDHGCSVQGGLRMLTAQAEASWRIWMADQ